MKRADLAAVGVLAVAIAVVGLGFRNVYETWAFAAPVVFCVVAASMTSIMCAHLRVPVGLAVLASLMLLASLGSAIVEGVVPPLGLVDFVDTVTASWRLMLDVSPPLATSGRDIAVPVLTSWVAATIGAELTLRTRSAVLPLIGPASMLVVVVLFGVADEPTIRWSGAALFALAVGFVLIRGRARTGAGRSTVVGRFVLVTALVLAAFAAPVVARNLPFSESRDRVTLRETYEPAFDPQRIASPLSLVKESLVEPMRDDRLFTIAGPAIDRVRLAVLTEYDGVVFTMASRDRTAFRSVSNELPDVPGEPELGDIETFRVTIDELAGPWLPVPGSPVAVRTVPGFSQEDLRFDPADANLLSRETLVPGQAYEIDVRTVRSYAADGPAPILVESAAAGAPFSELGLSIIGDAVDSTTRLDRLRTWFTTNGYYDSAAKAGHTLDRLLAFTGAPELIGFDEQYAAAFAVLAQSVGLDVRVVVGFEIGDDGATTDVLRADMKAWNEVRVDEFGWVTLDVVPTLPKQIDDEEVAAEQDTGRLPEAPPIEEEPVTSTTLPDLQEEEPDDEPSSPGSGFRFTLATTVAAAGALAVLLGAALVVLIVGLKGRRRRRRARAETTHQQVTGAWDELVDRSADLGCRPLVGSTIAERAATISDDLSLDAAFISPLAVAAERACFEREVPTDNEVQQAWNDLTRVEQLIVQTCTARARARAAVRTRSLRSRRR